MEVVFASTSPFTSPSHSSRVLGTSFVPGRAGDHDHETYIS